MDRLNKAHGSAYQKPDPERAHEVGSSVEYYKLPEHKGAPGWRGPATVTAPPFEGKISLRHGNKDLMAPTEVVR